MVGAIVLADSGDEIDCARMGSGGYGIPSIVEPEVIQFKKVRRQVRPARRKRHGLAAIQRRQVLAHAPLHFNARRRPNRPAACGACLYRLHNELKLPVYCLLDNDPWGYYIYSVIKQGSINLAFESQRMAVPDARFLGLRSIDFKRCGLSDSVKISLSDTDRKRAKTDRQLPLVRAQEGVAKRNQGDVGKRLQTGSGSPCEQGHQLRHRAVHATTAEREGLARLEATGSVSPNDGLVATAAAVFSAARRVRCDAIDHSGLEREGPSRGPEQRTIMKKTLRTFLAVAVTPRRSRPHCRTGSRRWPSRRPR